MKDKSPSILVSDTLKKQENNPISGTVRITRKLPQIHVVDRAHFDDWLKKYVRIDPCSRISLEFSYDDYLNYINTKYRTVGFSKKTFSSVLRDHFKEEQSKQQVVFFARSKVFINGIKIIDWRNPNSKTELNNEENKVVPDFLRIIETKNEQNVTALKHEYDSLLQFLKNVHLLNSEQSEIFSKLMKAKKEFSMIKMVEHRESKK